MHWFVTKLLFNELTSLFDAIWSMQFVSFCALTSCLFFPGITMPGRKGLLAPQNTFLDTIATRFDGTRKFLQNECPMGRRWTCLFRENNQIEY